MLKRLLGLITLALFFSVITAVLLHKDYKTYLDTPLTIESPAVFTVEAGMSFSDVNRQLSQLGLNRNAEYLEILARYSGKANKIKTGEYLLPVGLKPEELLDVFVAGKEIQYSFTLLEGWHIREMLEAIHATDLLIHTLTDVSEDTLMQELGYTETVAEGLFFPDTYSFPKNTTDKAFLQRAYQQLQHVLAEEWQTRAENLPYQTPYEALVMASIIEKETGLASERGTIAGVFVRRLNKNMKLQTDPTVIYAMGKQYDGNIRKKDLEIDSPHNTYRYKGLPPTPIALVGREAIHAALHPEEGKSLYFVAKGDGSHYFSENLTEHNRAVAKYQLKK
jgi:UPF0755 protein